MEFVRVEDASMYDSQEVIDSMKPYEVWPIMLVDEADIHDLKNRCFLLGPHGKVRFINDGTYQFKSIFLAEVEKVLNKEMGHKSKIVDSNRTLVAGLGAYTPYIDKCRQKMVQHVLSGGEISNACLESIVPSQLEVVLRNELLKRLRPARAMTSVQLDLPYAYRCLVETEESSSGEELNQLTVELLNFSQGFKLKPKLASVALAIAEKGVKLDRTAVALKNYAKSLTVFDTNIELAIVVQTEAVQILKTELVAAKESKTSFKGAVDYLENRLADFESYLKELKQLEVGK